MNQQQLLAGETLEVRPGQDVGAAVAQGARWAGGEPEVSLRCETVSWELCQSVSHSHHIRSVLPYLEPS